MKRKQLFNQRSLEKITVNQTTIAIARLNKSRIFDKQIVTQLAGCGVP
ncbi:hypothetical protein H6G27_02550 [Nostoc linckia FACHB-104]|nr:hypothetical protein [Nostoc linckia FACHB-104]